MSLYFFFQELEDLMCLVCRRMDVSARNRLIECADCHSLYHQECHKPPISDSDANEQEFSWCCSLCKNKIKSSSVASPAKSSSSHSSSSSSSSSYNNNKHTSSSKSVEPALPVSSQSSSSSSSSKSKSSKLTSSSKSNPSHLATNSNSSERSSSNSNSKPSLSGVTPNINIISADKRLQNMKKKAAKLHESRRKHK